MRRVRRRQRTKALLPEEINIGKRVSNRCEAMGLMVRTIAHLNIMSPAFVITRSEVDFVVDSLRSGIEATMADLRKEGVWRG